MTRISSFTGAVFVRTESGVTLKFGSNISSLSAQRRLGDATDALTDTYSRLSSGLRINKASDDAAGLAIASDLKNRSRVFTQGVRNGNDGLSVLNIADSALDGLSTLVTRIRELATQAANGSYSRNQRTVIDAEAQALRAEFFRIAQSTSFNGTNLFDGSLGDGLRLQLGIGLNGSVLSGVGGAIGTGKFKVGSTSTDLNNVDLAKTEVVDVNGDGILDSITSGRTGAGNSFVNVSIGNGDGSFGTARSYAGDNISQGFDFAIGDMDGDGVVDIVTAEDGTIAVRLGNGDGSFGARTTTFIQNTPFDATLNKIALGDINNDGRLDVVGIGLYDPSLADGDEVQSYFTFTGNGNGTLSAGATGAIVGSNVLVLRDINNDGSLDIIGPSATGVSVRLGTGSGQFGSAAAYAVGEETLNALALGDINGDGVADLVTAGSADGIDHTTVRLGTANGTFSSTFTEYESDGAGIFDLKLADVNADGLLDIVTAGYDGSTTNATLGVRLGRGNGTFGASQTTVVFDTSLQATSSIASLTSIAVGDLNGDGVIDFLAAGAVDPGGTIASTSTALLSQTQQGIGPLINFSLKTAADALQAFGPLDDALDNLAKQRGVIGAHQSRIASALGALSSTRDNYLTATGRIQDADIATESAALVRLQILQQAGAAILAQANQQPATALQLLN